MRILALFLFAIFLQACSTQIEKTMSFATDVHSYAQPNKTSVNHLHWKASVDFDQKIISATATWTLATPHSDTLILDTKGLTIEKVWLDETTSTSFELGKEDAILGQPLAIVLASNTKTVSIQYTTHAEAEAVQWLSPQQTAGKKFPFLFTQSQAILARSWVPCQDSPSVRFTYSADVTVPKDLLAMMSASNPQQKNKQGVYHFDMKQPISSYLLALAVGDVTFKAVSGRTGVYAEPSVIDKAVWEFADLEKMVASAEELYGAYPWERYDVLVLPPSFPFGGMENPRLTFATPTILTGDRSLTSLIAHELAHSWSGNLVTNATWNDFWLNEGFTVYFEHRIMEKLYGRDYSEMLATLSLAELNATVRDLSEGEFPNDTKLKLDLAGRSPDDGVTDIAYNKGYFFLRLLEEKYGREKFDQFLKDYFSNNAFRVMDTDGFMKYVSSYYEKQFQVTVDPTLYTEWIFTTGLPASCPQPQSNRFAQVDAALMQWKENKSLDTAQTNTWSTHEWLHFIKNLPQQLSAAQLSALDKAYGFTASGNAEITAAWLPVAIRNQYAVADAKLELFLINTGRRKFLSPLYQELIKTPEGKARAKTIYAKARPNYHFVAMATFDKLLQE